VVHTLYAIGRTTPVKLPGYGYVSPLSTGGYPALEATAQATSGLHNPDAIMGAVRLGPTTNGRLCRKDADGPTLV